MDQVEKELFEALLKQGYAMEMSYDREYVRNKLEAKGPTIGEHILKIVVYKDDKQYLPGYVEEISNELQVLSIYDLKPKEKKLEPQEYAKRLGWNFGESVNDMYAQLMDFRQTYTRPSSKKPYPPFTVTRKLAEELFTVYTAIISAVSVQLAKPGETENEVFKEIIRKVLEQQGITY